MLGKKHSKATENAISKKGLGLCRLRAVTGEGKNTSEDIRMCPKAHSVGNQPADMFLGCVRKP